MSMEGFLFDALSKQLVSAGLPILMMAFAVWWLNKKSEAGAAAAQATQKEFIAALNQERNERIQILEEKSDICEKDRYSLREQLIEILKHDRVLSLNREQEAIETKKPSA